MKDPKWVTQKKGNSTQQFILYWKDKQVFYTGVHQRPAWMWLSKINF